MSGVFTSAFAQGGNGLYLGSRYGYSGSSYSGSSYNRTMTAPNLASLINRNYAADIQRYYTALEDNDIAKAMEILKELRQEANMIATDRNATVDDGTIETALARCGVSESTACEYANGSFMTGLLNGIPLVGLLFNSYSKGEIQNAFEGRQTQAKYVIGESIGKTISGAATGAMIGTAIAPGIGTAIGAGIGVAVAFIQNKLKDAYNEA